MEVCEVAGCGAPAPHIVGPNRSHQMCDEHFDKWLHPFAGAFSKMPRFTEEGYAMSETRPLATVGEREAALLGAVGEWMRRNAELSRERDALRAQVARLREALAHAVYRKHANSVCSACGLIDQMLAAPTTQGGCDERDEV